MKKPTARKPGRRVGSVGLGGKKRHPGRKIGSVTLGGKKRPLVSCARVIGRRTKKYGPLNEKIRVKARAKKIPLNPRPALIREFVDMGYISIADAIYAQTEWRVQNYRMSRRKANLAASRDVARWIKGLDLR